MKFGTDTDYWCAYKLCSKYCL